MLKILTTIIILTIICGSYVIREIGKTPSEEELKKYESLPYFKNGEFQSPQKMVYDFDNVRNGPASWLRFVKKSPFAPKQELPMKKLTKADFNQNADDFALYWLGHSSALLELNGKRILLDPVFGNAAPVPFMVPRYGKAPIKIEDLPQIDLVVISHNHYDHLERKTVQKLKNSHFIVPLGVGAALRGWGIKAENITELGWEEDFNQNNLKITAETAVHYSGRGLGDRNKTLWNSYIIESNNKRIFWSGDSGYGTHFKEIGKKYGPFDLAAIEIDGWNTGWTNTHMFPQEIIKATQELGAKKLLPLHWAVFDLALHPWHESIDMLLQENQNTDIQILTPLMGEKINNLTTQTQKWWSNKE